MSHKKSHNKNIDEFENNDLGYYESKVDSLKKTVKQLEKKRRKMLKEMKKMHR